MAPPDSRLLVVALVGCARDPVEAGTTAEAEDLPGAYVADDDGFETPLYDQASVEAIMASAIEVALTLSAGPVLDGYDAAMAESDEDCPTHYTMDGNEFWYDACESASGASFDGYAFGYEYVDYAPGDGMTYNGSALYGVVAIGLSDGSRFEAGGSAYDLTGEHTDGYFVYQSVLDGSFAWDGSGSEGSWLEDGIAPSLTVYAVEAPGTSMKLAYFAGGVTGLGPAGDTVVLDELFMATLAVGSACEDEPGGTFSVRAIDGSWFDIVFDGPSSFEELDGTDPAECDGCGRAWYRGEEVGTACADFSPWIDWSGKPW